MIRAVIAQCRRGWRRLRRAWMGQALILVYHRLGERTVDPWGLCVSPAHFDEHLAAIRRYARPQRLAQLFRGGELSAIPPRSVVVTFDDGYADSYRLGRPLLEKHDVPATVFVVSGRIGCTQEFWWDELERLLLEPGNRPPSLRLTIGGRIHEWALGETTRVATNRRPEDQTWKAWDQDHPTPYHSLYRALWLLLQTLSERERSRILEDLRTWAGCTSEARPSHRILSVEELGALAEGELVEIGCHTVTHPVLSTLPVGSQREEIQQSKRFLEGVLNRKISAFAYPYGQRTDYTPETTELVRQAGFTCACSNFAGVVRKGADPFQLPRLQVRDWDGDEFARRLTEWLET